MDERSTRNGEVLGRRLPAWLPVAVWAGLIFALSSQPDLRFASDPGIDFVVRKVGHMGAFGILALFLWRGQAAMTSNRRWAWSFGLAVTYAATDELHQALVAGRHASIVDVGFDATGALIALGAVGILSARRGRDA
jgi:VanZ family protein